MTLFAGELRCSRCRWAEPVSRLRNLCPECGSPILVAAETDAATFRPLPRFDMWRYAAVLPVRDESAIVTLGEGMTPLLEARSVANRLGCERVYVKDESKNPTRSFKSRGMSAAVTMAVGLGATRLAAPTAGNAGCALAAYAARADVEAFTAMPRDTPRSIVDECRSYGATVELVEGVITDAARRVQQHVADSGAFDLSTLKEPYRVEGKKTMAYEIVEQLGRIPDVILYPAGGGTGLIGMWKAFSEMETLGLIGRERPRMFAVQSSGCAPIVRAFDAGAETAAEWESPHTRAWGLRVPRAIGDRLMLAALRESSGGAVAVAEEEIEPAATRLRLEEGIDAGPEGGAVLLALETLLARRTITESGSVVLFNTGGDKYRD